MKLIAESGSTKTEWSLIEEDNLIEHFNTEGINPFFQTRREISRSIRLGLPERFFKKKIEMIYYYGAGCSSEEKKQAVGASLITQFKTHVQVESDLLGAARGLFLQESGIACILGTGSNSCFYDGKNIMNNVTAGGYILGDEGSGAAAGKEFLADVLKGLAPGGLTNDFLNKNHITVNDIMNAVYNQPLPNKFLNSVSNFFTNYKNEEYVIDIITNNFKRFFTRCVFQYNYRNYPIRFVGSMANNFKELLTNVAQSYDIEISAIEESQMNGLIKYHGNEKDIKKK
jgi:N-acetylglucosamine kinase-like BadF-type ATPase